MHRVDKISAHVRRLTEMDQGVKLDNLKKKLVLDIVNEQLTPLKRNLNLDFKKLRSHLEECLAATEEH